MEGLIQGQYLESPKDCRRETPLEILQRRKVQCEKELKRVNEALEVLEANPQITQVMEVVSRALG